MAKRKGVYAWGDRITIRFKDPSRSQEFQCAFAWKDGFNTVVYCEEGAPHLIGNSHYEVVCDGWNRSEQSRAEAQEKAS